MNLKHDTLLSKLAFNRNLRHYTMAHALDAGPLCAELEDLSLQELFPTSYKSLQQWLQGTAPYLNT